MQSEPCEGDSRQPEQLGQTSRLEVKKAVGQCEKDEAAHALDYEPGQFGPSKPRGGA